MPSYKIRLNRREEIAEGTMAFYFEKPSGFAFQPGHFGNFSLLDPPETDDEGNMRSFSIASAPFEEGLMVATRLRDSAFKRVLKSVPLGTEVKLAAPFGSFTLHEDSRRPAVFLVGGIGITPFRSMILDAVHNQLPHHLALFYSNRRPEDAAFLDDLDQLSEKNSNFKLVATMTEIENSHETWQGERGFIRRDLLDKYVGHLRNPVYYTAGPPGMVKAMRELLLGMGVSQDNLRTEDFAGY